MKRLLLALALFLLPAAAAAQCNGVFPASTLCGNNTGSSGIPGQFPASSLVGLLPLPNTQIYVGNVSNVAAAVAMTGDASITNTGLVTVNAAHTPTITGASTFLSSVLISNIAPIFELTETDTSTNWFWVADSSVLEMRPTSLGTTALQRFTPTGVTFTVAPTSITPTQGDNTTKLATTAFVSTALSAVVSGPGSAVVGDLPTFSNTGGTAIADSGFTASQIPGLPPTTATVTISNASPGVVTWTSHGLQPNAVVYFCTTGTLPTGLTACTQAASAQLGLNSSPTLYYVVGSSITTNTFQVATTIANAKAGISVNTSSAGSGTHTGFANVFACAGCVGEYVYSITQITNGNVTSGADTVFNSISLSAGIWKIGGSTGVFGAAGAVFTTNHASMGLGITTICTTPYCGTTDWHFATNNANGVLFPFNEIIIPVFSTSTLNAVCEPVFSGATATCFGELHAVRVH